MTPLKLTDDEMNAVYAACRPLHVADRDVFLQAIADALRQRGEIGPGAVQRAIRDVQRRFFRPPELEEARALVRAPSCRCGPWRRPPRRWSPAWVRLRACP
jgi:hypothetical protein